MVLYGLFALQVRRATVREREKTEVRHAERERIARDLHDSFLQVLSFLLLRFDRIGREISPDERARLKIDEALDQAEAAISDGRDRVSVLRDNTEKVVDVELCLSEFVDEISRDYSITCSVNAHSTLRDIRADAGDEICNIGKEALKNAFRHANASRIDVDIYYGRRRFVMVIRDNGGGLPEAFERNQQREGHWGLLGMRERANAIGGTLQVRRPPGGGTEVSLRVSGGNVYCRHKN